MRILHPVIRLRLSICWTDHLKGKNYDFMTLADREGFRIICNLLILLVELIGIEPTTS